MFSIFQCLSKRVTLNHLPRCSGVFGVAPWICFSLFQPAFSARRVIFVNSEVHAEATVLFVSGWQCWQTGWENKLRWKKFLRKQRAMIKDSVKFQVYVEREAARKKVNFQSNLGQHNIFMFDRNLNFSAAKGCWVNTTRQNTQSKFAGTTMNHDGWLYTRGFWSQNSRLDKEDGEEDERNREGWKEKLHLSMLGLGNKVLNAAYRKERLMVSVYYRQRWWTKRLMNNWMYGRDADGN